MAWQAIEFFRAKVANIRKKAQRARELERRRLRRLEQRTGARGTVSPRDDEVRNPNGSLLAVKKSWLLGLTLGAFLVGALQVTCGETACHRPYTLWCTL